MPDTATDRQERDALLATLDLAIDAISASQHELSRPKAVLEQQRTRLRIGTAPVIVRAALEHAAALPT